MKNVNKDALSGHFFNNNPTKLQTQTKRVKSVPFASKLTYSMDSGFESEGESEINYDVAEITINVLKLMASNGLVANQALNRAIKLCMCNSKHSVFNSVHVKNISKYIKLLPITCNSL